MEGETGKSEEKNIVKVSGKEYDAINLEQGTELRDKSALPIPGGYIFVDFEKSEELKKLFEMVNKRALEEGGNEEDYLKVIFKIVNSAFEVTFEKAVDAFTSKKIHLGEPTIPLDVYLKDKIGNCPQAMLAAGILISKLNEEGLTKGKPYMGYLEGERGSHLWVEIRTPGAEAVILDPMQNYIGGPEGHKVIEDRMMIEFMMDD